MVGMGITVKSINPYDLPALARAMESGRAVPKSAAGTPGEEKPNVR